MSDDETRSIDRILIALDASPHSRAALNAAVRLAMVMDAGLHGLYVEEESVLRAAEMPFTDEVRAFSAGPKPLTSRRVERQLRDQADHAKHVFERWAEESGRPHQFDVVRGDVVPTILEAADDADLLAFGKAGNASSRRRLGSKARALLQQASIPVLILREPLRYFQPVLTYFDGSDAAETALQLSARLAERSEASTLKILLPGAHAARYASLRRTVRSAYANRLEGLYVRAVSEPAPAELAAVAREECTGLVVLPDVLQGDEADVRSFLYELDRPLTLIR
jgi:nucleotide-binding universal stress UspA family protein